MKTENSEKTDLCGETELLIDEYLDGMISLSDKEKMDSHISVCSSCSAYFKDTSALVSSLNSFPLNDSALSIQNKIEIWDKVESGIDRNKYNEFSSSLKNTEVQEIPVKENFIEKYKYILSGIAAVVALVFIVYGVKNMKTGNDRMSEQSNYGLVSYWKVSNLQGSSMIGNAAMSSNDSIKEGQWIQTNGSSRAELIVADIGKIIIEPNSKIVFVKSADGNNRIQVEYGTINADMNSKARSFFVEMPSAVAKDNGGTYTITIDSAGDGLLYVKSGKVDVQSPGKEIIVPAGNIVLTKRDIGAGTPFNENSSPRFKNALFNFDFGKCGGTCVAALLDNAKMSDAVTLVNLLPNIEKEYSDEVYAKVANFVKPPSNIHSDSIPFIDEQKLNEWIDKIQTEVQLNVEKSMKDVEKNLDNLKDIENLKPEEIQGLEDFAKNWKFQIKTSPKGNYVWDEDSAEFDKEQFRKDMEEMKKELKEDNTENKEQLKKDLDQLKEDLKEMNIDIKENINLNNEQLKKELEKANEEIRKAMKDVQKIKIPDSLQQRKSIKVIPKDGFEENNIKSEEPAAPEIPDEQEDENK